MHVVVVFWVFLPVEQVVFSIFMLPFSIFSPFDRFV